MRRAGATYEEIAKAGGGIASTVAKTRAASDDELLEQSRRRLHALMSGGCTTIEVKSGYGLDPKSELRLLKIVKRLGADEAVRIVPTLLALHALPADQRDRRAHYVSEIVDKLIPEVAKAKLAASVDAFCETIAFTPDEVERVFKAAAQHGLRVRLHAEQLSNQHGAELAAQHRALSADHLEYLDEDGAKAMARRARSRCCYPARSTRCRRSRKPPVELLRKHKVPIAIATDCNPGTSPMLSRTLAMNMACTLFGLTPEEALAGMTDQCRPGARSGKGGRKSRFQARPRIFASGASNLLPSSATGSACPGPSEGFLQGRTRHPELVSGSVLVKGGAGLGNGC